MKKLLIILTLSAFLLVDNKVAAQVADSVDVLDYDLTLDMSATPPLRGDAVITLQLLRPCATIKLDGVLAIDSVEVNGQRLENPNLNALPTAGIAAGMPFTIRVWYYTIGYVEGYGFGGLHLDADMSYNLGAAFEDNPHVIGRAVFPCRDNFHDKATYTLRIKTKPDWTAECGGICQSAAVDTAGMEHSVWRIAQQTPTYLVGVSQAPWKRIRDSIPSLYGTYPVTYGYLYPDSTQVRNAFSELGAVVPMFERCFGPYRWGRIGYIATEKGSMEHVNNIALARQALTSTEEFAKNNIHHELGHAWFGNLITCATEGDMWINEGGASFTGEVAKEAAHGRAVSNDYYQRNLEEVMRSTHIKDGGRYRALHNMIHSYTYGSTSYDKGWMVWHSLRGYLGDSLFYASLRQLMDRCAFGNIDADGVRDSLSLYSGVDLTGFFNFHVFGPGFVNYVVDIAPAEGYQTLSNVRIAISQSNIGTNNLAYSNRIPITFFSPALDTCKVWIAFQGADTVIDNLALPFTPTFWVLDYDQEISDAATNSEAHFATGGTENLTVAHAAVTAQGAADLYVTHHWGHPDRLPYGVVRAASRYWVVNGQWNAAVQGRFHFVRDGYQGNSPNLDKGFYWNTSSRDSIYLLFRPSPSTDWQVVSHSRTGSSQNGYMVTDSLMAGEYTLAIVDTLQLGLADPTAPGSTLHLFPNPVEQGQPLCVDVPTTEPFTITVVDAGGRQVWLRKGCTTGEMIRPALPKGIYFVQIENNFISLQSKLIQL